jgi:ABC-type uncharacterized transport system permease subunit
MIDLLLIGVNIGCTISTAYYFLPLRGSDSLMKTAVKIGLCSAIAQLIMGMFIGIFLGPLL